MLVQTLPVTRGISPRLIDPAANRDESAVFCLRACLHESHFSDNLLAVRWVRGGREQGSLGGRTLVLDDDTYLFINENRSYDVRFSSATPMQSFAVYFRRGLADEVLAGLEMPLDAQLDGQLHGDGVSALYPIGF